MSEKLSQNSIGYDLFLKIHVRKHMSVFSPIDFNVSVCRHGQQMFVKVTDVNKH